MGKVDATESDLDRCQAQVKASVLFRISDNLYVGPMASYDLSLIHIYLSEHKIQKNDIVTILPETFVHVHRQSPDCRRCV